ncbi:MAG: hypothetical protein ABSC21_19480 [Terriglobia bacterium]|jgi:hypothetical protein
MPVISYPNGPLAHDYSPDGVLYPVNLLNGNELPLPYGAQDLYVNGQLVGD